MSVHPYDPYSDPEIDGQDDVPPHTEPPKPARPRPAEDDPPW